MFYIEIYILGFQGVLFNFTLLLLLGSIYMEESWLYKQQNFSKINDGIAYYIFFSLVFIYFNIFSMCLFYSIFIKSIYLLHYVFDFTNYI